MKKIQFSLVVILILAISSCCVNKDECSVMSFKDFRMVGFAFEDFADSVIVTEYDAATGFTQVIQSRKIPAKATDNSSVYLIETPELKTSYNYEVSVLKIAKKYRISDYRFEKIACGRCFMRSNNNFGYNLVSYSLDNKMQEFEGQIFINK
jgi:hypothetical protein